MSDHDCAVCGSASVDSHHRCDDESLLEQLLEQADQADPDCPPSDELRLAMGFSMLDDDYYV